MDYDEDLFDDDFDDIPSGTLFQLEQNAYQATQGRQQTPQQPPARPANPLPNTSIGDIGQSGNVNPNPKTPSLHTGFSHYYGNVDDVGELDAEVVDNDDTGTSALELAIAFADKRTRQYQHVQAPVAVGSGQVHNFPMDESMVDVHDGQPQHEQEATYEAHELLERFRVEHERNQALKEELAAAKSLVEDKGGENAIIRARYTKLEQELERKLAEQNGLRKEYQKELRGNSDELHEQIKMVTTENAFLHRDLNDEIARYKDIEAKYKALLNADKVAEKVTEKAPPLTPRKTKPLPFRDGFDEDEILAVSPSKSAVSQSKQPTPVVPGKRKRKVSADSPTKLQLRSPEPMVEEAPGHVSDDPMLLDTDMGRDKREPTPRPPPKNNANLEFMKQILDHRSYPNKEQDLEVMARWSFPSEPERKLSSIVLKGLSKLKSDNYVVGYTGIIASLWSRALKERFFRPIPLFMAIINFLLAMDTYKSVPGMIEHLVPVLQVSAEVNGVTRFTHSSLFGGNMGKAHRTPQSRLEPDVDSTEALGLLYRMTTGCLHLEEPMVNFWRNIRYDFILAMLNPSQLIEDVTLTMSLLITSIRENSFGPIHEPQENVEGFIIERAAHLLSEKPIEDEGKEPYTKMEICDMRLEILAFLMAVAFPPTTPVNEHGTAVIAAHPIVLALLIRSMHDELDALYSYPAERDMHATLVNGLMRLVYGVMQQHKDVDLQSKLARVPGGKQKFLVVLTRLAFSEGPILEEGIEDETVEMAHEVLDGAVNPEEAEALLDAFPNAKLY